VKKSQHALPQSIIEKLILFLIANPTIKLFGGDGVIHEKLAIN
jgi:hypothetical protein